MKNKLFIISLICICLSFIALDCPKNLITVPQNPPPTDNKSTIIIYSTNGGETWQSGNGFTVGAKYNCVTGIEHFIAQEPGTYSIIADSSYPYNHSVIMKTTDYGSNWERFQGYGFNRPITIYDIYSEFNNKGFFAGDFDGNNIYITENAGSTWSHVINTVAGGILRLDFDDEMEQGIAIPYNPADSILITSNGGTTWLPRSPIFIADNINDIAVIGENTAVACGNNGRIFLTTNLGDSWMQRNSPTNETLNSISMWGYNGLIAGNNGALLKTTNAGFNWTAITSSTSQHLTKAEVGNPAFPSFVCGDNIIISVEFSFNGTSIIRNASNEYYKDISIAGNDVVFVVGYKTQ